MELSHPVVITSRLCPGLRIGPAEVSICYAPRPGDNGRTRYRWHIDLPGIEETSDDLQSGCQGGTLQEGLSSLMSFLSAWAESLEYQQRTNRGADNAGLFPLTLAQWATENSGELSMLACELEEMDAIAENR